MSSVKCFEYVHFSLALLLYYYYYYNYYDYIDYYWQFSTMNYQKQKQLAAMIVWINEEQSSWMRKQHAAKDINLGRTDDSGESYKSNTHLGKCMNLE